MTILKSMADASWNWLGQRAQRDEVDEEVDEVVSAIKDRRGWMLSVFFVFLSAPFLIDRVVKLHVAGVWGIADHDVLRTLMFGRATIGVTVGNIIFTLVCVRGSCSNAEWNVLAVFMHMLFFLNRWGTDNTFDLMRLAAVGGSLRVVFAVVVCKVHLVFALNAISFCSVCARSHWAQLSDAGVDFIMLELSLCLMTTMMSAFSDSLMRREAKVMLQATLAARSERTTQELLSLVCDAVLTLDRHFCLRNPSPAHRELCCSTRQLNRSVESTLRKWSVTMTVNGLGSSSLAAYVLDACICICETPAARGLPCSSSTPASKVCLGNCPT